MSFVEIDAAPSLDDVARIIAEDILGLPADWRARYSSGRYGLALETLTAGELDVGTELQLLESDIRETAARLEDKVIAVTIGGEEIFSNRDAPAV